MFYKHLRILGGTLFLLAMQISATCRAEMRVFGDSLSETGNFFALSAGTWPPAPLYDDGRFSNGTVWVEHLAKALGEPVPTPSLQGGSNYSFNGSRAAGASIPYGTPDLEGQVALYLATCEGVAEADDIFVIWAGANDILLGSGEPDFLANAIQGVSQAIRTLHAAGARKFVVLDLPSLGQTPFFNEMPAVAAELDLASSAFNSYLASELRGLRSELSGSRIADVKISQLFRLITCFPKVFGLRNVTDSATVFFPDSGIGFQLMPGVNPDRYLFWDSVHPTAQTHKLIATYAFIDYKIYCRRR